MNQEPRSQPTNSAMRGSDVDEPTSMGITTTASVTRSEARNRLPGPPAQYQSDRAVREKAIRIPPVNCLCADPRRINRKLYRGYRNQFIASRRNRAHNG